MDASCYGIGAVLAKIQKVPETQVEKEVVIAYSSKVLNDRKAKGSTTENDACAIIHAIQLFTPYVQYMVETF